MTVSFMERSPPVKRPSCQNGELLSDVPDKMVCTFSGMILLCDEVGDKKSKQKGRRDKT